MSFADFKSEFSESDFDLGESVFHDYSYLGKMEEALKSPMKIFLSKSKTEDSVVALAMFSREDYEGLTLAPFTPFNPVWALNTKKEDFGNALSNIWEKLSKFNGRHHCHLAPSLNALSLQNDLWIREEFFTYHIGLENDGWSKKYSKSLSRLIKKGSDEVEIQVDNTKSDLVCDFVATSYERNKRNLPLAKDSMKELAKSMINIGLADVYLAREKSSGEIRAGVVCLRKGKESYYWLAGGSRGIWMTILIDELLANLSSQAFATFDFLGANHSSIAEFKRRFGGEIISYQGFQLNIGARAKMRAMISGIVKK